MSFPPHRFWLALSRLPWVRACVRPERDRPDPTSWREETQERHRPELRGILRTLPGIVTSYPFCPLSKCWPRSELRPSHADLRDTAANAPALLRIEGPIATITLNRPAAFNSIDLYRAKAPAAKAARSRATTISLPVIEGEGRAFSAGGDLQTIGAAAANDTIAPVVGELLKHYHAFIETLRRCRRSCSPASTAPPPAPAWGWPSSPTSHCRRRTRLHAGLCQDRRLAGWRQHGRHGRYRRHPARAADPFWPKTVLPRSRPMNGAWSRASFRQRS